MRIPLTVIATTAIAATLAGVSACGNDSKQATPASGSSTTSHPVITDYTTLLIKADDIKAPDAFTAGPATKDPNGQQGATVTFTDSDKSHAIIDTIQVLPDVNAAAEALVAAKATHRETLLAKSLNAEVGVGGATISGLSPDHSKGVTVLVFTAARALVTLEFDGPSFALAPPEFITDVGQKQDEAIKKALG
ncbi:hypothetical protein PT015_05385 [Candidatus Mycobacterium wuenschmannii]|uniref:Lipoprotein LpqN n=1 Tax=Candidatus Mycobacterium wuenschmannii TaxID=3027808 RepID=A0ABY8W1B8_9MYCO|nr:hypothetical protein [Candidatus Mycobacterium wuenschmannii]WIM88911.1 hypothetical protein PT015_05385 [Candidatus Mycobacterium wuenschmannii]